MDFRAASAPLCDAQTLTLIALRLAHPQYVAPCSDIEVVVQGVWQQVLGLESPPSVESDFFAIGGTSLIGLKVTAAMRKALGFNASLPGAHALQTVSTCFLWYHQVPERRLSCDARTLCGSANLS